MSPYNVLNACTYVTQTEHWQIVSIVQGSGSTVVLLAGTARNGYEVAFRDVQTVVVGIGLESVQLQIHG